MRIKKKEKKQQPQNNAIEIQCKFTVIYVHFPSFNRFNKGLQDCTTIRAVLHVFQKDNREINCFCLSQQCLRQRCE